MVIAAAWAVAFAFGGTNVVRLGTTWHDLARPECLASYKRKIHGVTDEIYRGCVTQES